MSRKLFLPIFVLTLLALACGRTSTPEAPTTTPQGEVSAKDAIQTYASSVLGLEVDKLWAGGTEGDISLPTWLQHDVDVAINLSGETYFGLWTQGIAMLAFGNGEVSGDFNADIKDGAMAVFIVREGGGYPEDANAALNMLLQTYPALNRYTWEELPDKTGFSFTATNPQDFGIQSWSLELTGTMLKAGVMPGIGGQNAVWVVTASGALSKPFE
ncbi:MAG TPA: hypothetical protein EYP88_04220 [Anaerolineales bacterium]|nr:hypothetical protein [Anaerolineales bacterium]